MKRTTVETKNHHGPASSIDEAGQRRNVDLHAPERFHFPPALRRHVQHQRQALGFQCLG